MRHLCSALTAGLIALAGMVVMAPSASAHHATVSAQAVCADGGGYEVTWIVANWRSTGTNAVRLTASSRPAVPVGTTFTNGQSRTFSENVATPQALTLTVSSRWDNGVTSTDSGRITADRFPDCTQDVTAAAPSASEPTCEADGRLRVRDDTDAVRYEQTPGGTGPGTYEVTAVAADGYRLTGTSQWIVTVEPRLTGPECDVPARPVAPEVELIEECGEYGSIVLPETTGVRYELTAGDGREGPYTVTATALPGYTFEPGTTTEFSGDLGRYTECVTPAGPSVTDPTCEEPGELVLPDDEHVVDGPECDVPVVPVGPDVQQAEACGVPGAVILPETEGIDYQLVAGDGAFGEFTVRAAAQEGSVIEPGTPTEFSGELGPRTSAEDCDEAPPEEPAEPQQAVSSSGALSGGGAKPGVLPATGSLVDAAPLAVLALLLLVGGGAVLTRQRLIR